MDRLPTAHLQCESGRSSLPLPAADGRNRQAWRSQSINSTSRFITDPTAFLNSADQLAERTLSADRGVAKPLALSDGQVFDLQPVQKTRITKARHQRTQWQKRATRRNQGSHNQQKAYRKAARYQRYEKQVRKVVR